MSGYGYTNQSYTDNSNRRSNGENWYPDTERWRRPTISSPPKSNHSSESYYATDYGYGSTTKLEPGYYGDKWRRPLSPVRDRPQNVEEYIGNVQTRPGLLSSTNWPHNPPNSGTSGYGEYAYYNNNNDWNKPNGHTIRDESLKDYYYGRNDGFNQPTMTNQYGWERPGHKGHNHETKLSGPTNDIGKAVEILKETANSTLVTATTSQPRFTLPASMAPKRDTYAQIIDNKGADRYGRFNLSSRSF